MTCPFNPGDTVRFAQRGLVCEVVADPDPQPGLVLCGWLDWREDYREAYFPVSSLILVERAKAVEQAVEESRKERKVKATS